MSTMNFTGEWTLENNDNLESYLEALGMEEDRRTQLLNARPVWVIEHVGTMIKVFIPRKQQTFYANVGEDIEWTLLDGSTQKSASYLDGDQLVRAGLTKSGQPHKTVLEIKDNMLVKTISVGDVVCVRKFKKTK